jgi:O-antigen ligase/polysaccharide polymerase Wzy-like membrane protein
MTEAPVVLYLALFIAALVAPLRWSIIAFLVLSNIDLGSLNERIGILNTGKAMVLPVILLWRFHAYSGHRKIATPPVMWSLLILYVVIASSWSLFPEYAIKLIGHMLGSLIICLMLTRATKAGYLSFETILPVTCGVIAMAVFHWLFLHNWGGETERFTTFSGAQAFAAFLTAFYCAALFAKTLNPTMRIALCLILIAAVIANGSRIWIIGILLSTLTAIFVSGVKPSIKILTLGVTVIVLAACTIAFDNVMDYIAHKAPTNRIAAAITDAYGGNLQSRGLGTYNLRHVLFDRTIQAIKSGSTAESILGHGTCNGYVIAATLSKTADPNRAIHNEWLRALYEWGVVGFSLWTGFILSLLIYAAKGVNGEAAAYAKPLVVYLPAFVLGLTGENIIAGAGNAVSVGLLVLISLSTISHRAKHRSMLAWQSRQEEILRTQLLKTTPGVVT